MAARTKLNQAYITGTLITAGILGGLTSSWMVFLVVAGVGLSLNIYGGEIRGKPNHRR